MKEVGMKSKPLTRAEVEKMGNSAVFWDRVTLGIVTAVMIVLSSLVLLAIASAVITITAYVGLTESAPQDSGVSPESRSIIVCPDGQDQCIPYEPHEWKFR